jgi:peroxiredoxin
MKSLLYTIAFFLLSVAYASSASAQVSTSGPQKVYRLPRLDERSVILDSAGRRVEYTAWTTLVNSGRYEVKVVVMENGKGALRLVKMTKAQRDAKFAKMAKPVESPFFTTGKAFKERFKAKDFSGEVWDSKRLKGKIVVISFWYVNNIQCRQQLPDLNEVAVSYSNDGDVVFLSVPLDDRKSVEEFLKYSPLAYKHLENGKEISEKLGVVGQPTDVVIDQNGLVQYHTTGYNAANAYWIGKTISLLKSVSNAIDTKEELVLSSK